MEYFDSKGQLVRIEDVKYITHGTSAEIYQIDGSLCLKKYYDFTTDEARISYEFFKLLKKINHPFVNKIIELYYDSHGELGFFSDAMPRAYSFLFIDEQDVDLFSCSSDYLLYNLRAHEELMQILTEYLVRVQDLKKDNTICSGDKIVLIDLDNCRIEKEAKIEEIRTWNRRRLTMLYIELIRRSNSFVNDYDESLRKLFSLQDFDSSITDIVAKRLKRSKSISDFMRY